MWRGYDIKTWVPRFVSGSCTDESCIYANQHACIHTYTHTHTHTHRQTHTKTCLTRFLLALARRDHAWWRAEAQALPWVGRPSCDVHIDTKTVLHISRQNSKLCDTWILIRSVTQHSWYFSNAYINKLVCTCLVDDGANVLISRQDPASGAHQSLYFCLCIRYNTRILQQASWPRAIQTCTQWMMNNEQWTIQEK